MKPEYTLLQTPELWNKFHNGEKGALAALLERYNDHMFKLARKQVNGNEEKANEALQNAHTKILENREKIKNWAYIKRIVINECNNIFRQDDKERKHVKHFLRDHATDLQGDVGKVNMPLIEAREEAAKWNTMCDGIINNAGFLWGEAKDIFRKAIRGQCDKKTLERCIRQDFGDSPGLNLEECLAFLQREAEHDLDLASGKPGRLQQYQEEIQRVILAHVPNADDSLVSLLIDAHMATSAWPGWPFAKWNNIANPLNPPKRVKDLINDLKKYSIGRNPKELQGIFELMHYESLNVRRKMKWPFETSH